MDDGSPIVAHIEKVLDELRQAIKLHQGDIQFYSYDNDIVTILLRGACISCPISEITVKYGIEEALRQQVDPRITVAVKQNE